MLYCKNTHNIGTSISFISRRLALLALSAGNPSNHNPTDGQIPSVGLFISYQLSYLGSTSLRSA